MNFDWEKIKFMYINSCMNEQPKKTQVSKLIKNNVDLPNFINKGTV
jgi:hypothetical protein